MILSGESEQEESLTIRLDEAAGLVGQGDIVQYTEKGKTKKINRTGNTVRVSVPGKGFRALAFPLAEPLQGESAILY